MHKIGLIIQREYWTRVKKKTFLIMTLLGPLFMALILIVPMGLSMLTHEEKNILVVDGQRYWAKNLKSSDKIQFTYVPIPTDAAKILFQNSAYDALLDVEMLDDSTRKEVVLLTKDNITLETQMFIENQIEKIVQEKNLAILGISPEVLAKTKTNISLQIKNQKDGEESQYHAATAMTFGLFFSVLIYIFIFMYGVQVMRGVIEEKTSRIVEVIITSVKPFELMVGKIIGIALVGLTQFVVWGVLTFGISQTVQNRFHVDRFNAQNIQTTLAQTPNIQQAMEMHYIVQALAEIPFVLILVSFLFYFLAGYVLYGAMFAAIGSAVDSETDTQQFMLPITLPLVGSFLAVQGIVQDPNGSLAKILSMVPFTSPISMMVRLPFGVPLSELLLSMLVLVVTCVGMVFLAGKIYATGILMYGKKASYKEILTWLRV